MNKNKLGLVFFPAFDWAISPTHPEREERLLYTRDQIVEEGILDLPGIVEYKPRLARMTDLDIVHVGIPQIASLITDAHLAAAGGAITAADAVLQGEVERAFALVRPPGHHAMRMVHGTRGFCTINIEAIMAESIRRRYPAKRLAIIDTDVHHGDGTQDIYYHDPDTLFISFHQDGRTLYPGSGFIEEAGSPGAFGTTINLPLPPGATDQDIQLLLEELVLPILADFQPDLIINSAGQDNHYSDPLANMAVSAQGYAKITDMLKADIAVLEGGYSIEDALPYVNTGIILAMAGEDYSRVLEPDYQKWQRQCRSGHTAAIRELINYWQPTWAKRREIGAAMRKTCGDFWHSRRNIYYDDSQLQEKQTEAVRQCSHCAGYSLLTSEAQGMSRWAAYVAILSRTACATCRKEAYDAVLQAKRNNSADFYFVQDKQHNMLEKI